MFHFCPLPSSKKAYNRYSKSNVLSNSTVSVTSVDTKDDPYYDEDAVNGFRTDTVVATPMLGENMMRKLLNRDPYDIYQPVKLLGTGSMGSVNMVKKREEYLGGSARFHNLSLQKKLELQGVHPYFVTIFTIPGIGAFFLGCSGIDIKAEDALSRSMHSRSVQSNMSDASVYEAQIGEYSPPNFNLQDINNSNRSHVSIIQPSHSRKPRHKAIIAYLKNERAQGKYEFHYALKSIHLSRVNDITYIRELKNEINLMKRLDHCNIVRPLETYQFSGQLYMLMELCSGGDLYARDPYTEEQAAHIVESLLSAVAYMHEHNIVHRDLKYENVMFVNSSRNSEIKIIDFGLSKKFLPDQKLKEGVGTIYTMAPEVLKKNYTSKADVWSVGVLAYMLLSSQMPFYGRKRREVVKKISKSTFDFKGRRWSTISSQAKDFVTELLRRDPTERPTAEEARKALWVNTGQSSFSSMRTEEGMAVVNKSLEHYSTLKVLQKLALMVIAHKSTSEEIGFLRKAFKRYNSEQHGTISLVEFKKCLSVHEYSESYMEHLFREVDLDGTGEIKYTEFLAASIESTGLITEERLAEAFDRLDSDDSGFITVDSLRALLGDEVSSDYVEGIIAESGIHEDKRISYDEFLSLWDLDLEVEERKLEIVRCISKARSVRHIEEEMIYASSTDEPGSDSELSHRNEPI